MAKNKLALIDGDGDAKMLERIGSELASRSSLEWFAEFVGTTRKRIRQAEQIAAEAQNDGAKDLSLRAVKAAHSMHADLIKIGSNVGVIANGERGPRVVNFNTVNVTGGGGPDGSPASDLASQVHRQLSELRDLMAAGGVSILDVEPQERVAMQIAAEEDRVATRAAPRQATKRAEKVLRGGALRRRRIVDTKEPEEKS